MSITTHELLDASTGDLIGTATADQVAASFAAGETGVIQIDEDGRVVDPGGWHTGTLRTVWVAA